MESKLFLGKHFYLDFKKGFYQDLAFPSAADLFDVLSEARAKQGRICLPIFSAWIFSMDFKILASLVISNCLEGNTMRNRGAYSTKERMPSDIDPPSTNQPGRLYLIGGVLPSRQKLGIGAISPAHPRFSRMYGVTNSTVFQTALNKRFFTTAGSYFVSVFCLSVVAPAG